MSAFTTQGGSLIVKFDALDNLPLTEPKEGKNILHLYALNAPPYGTGIGGGIGGGLELISTDMIEEGAITNELIADGAITTETIVDGAVTNEKITSMEAGKITGTIPASKITGLTTGGTTIGVDAIGTENIADGAVTADKCAADVPTFDDLNDLAARITIVQTESEGLINKTGVIAETDSGVIYPTCNAVREYVKTINVGADKITNWTNMANGAIPAVKITGLTPGNIADGAEIRPSLTNGWCEKKLKLPYIQPNQPTSAVILPYQSNGETIHGGITCLLDKTPQTVTGPFPAGFFRLFELDTGELGNIFIRYIVKYTLCDVSSIGSYYYNECIFLRHISESGVVEGVYAQSITSLGNTTLGGMSIVRDTRYDNIGFTTTSSDICFLQADIEAMLIYPVM